MNIVHTSHALFDFPCSSLVPLRSRCSSTKIRDYQLTPALLRPEIFLNEIISRSLIQRHEHPPNICCVLPNTQKSYILNIPPWYEWSPILSSIPELLLTSLCFRLKRSWPGCVPISPRGGHERLRPPQSSRHWRWLSTYLLSSVIFLRLWWIIFWSILFIHTRYGNINLQRMGKSSLWGRSVVPTEATSMPWRFVHASSWSSWLSS